MRRVFQFAVVAIVYFGYMSGLFGQQAIMPRTAVVEALKRNIRLSLNGDTGGASDAEIISLVDGEYEEQAARMLPEQLAARSQAIIDVATNMPLVIEYCDKDYICASVKLRLMAVQLAVAFGESFPPLTEQEKLQVKTSVDKARVALKDKMEQVLIPLNITGLKTEDIERASAIAIVGQTAKAESPLNYMLVKPLSDAEIDAIVIDFDVRLKDNGMMIKKEIEGIARRFGAGHASTSMIDSYLLRVLARPRKAILEETLDDHRRLFLQAKMDTSEWKDAQAKMDEAVQRYSKGKTPATRSATQP